jgi:hypothetical protein
MKRIRRMKRGYRLLGIGVCVAAALALTVVGLASCGGSTTSKKSTNSSTTKLPPGATTSETQSTVQSTAASSQPASSATGGSTTQSTQATPSASATLAGAQFTVVNATRPNTNQSVISSSARAVPGDYLQVELSIFNNGADGVVDLSQYSFRLQSPGIAADTYSTYYGNTGTYGAYVDTNEISGTLMDFTNLAAVTSKLKVGETLDKVFVFYDLNPLTNAPNAGVTKANTQFIIHKTSGTDYGTQVAIPLAGYPD